MSAVALVNERKAKRKKVADADLDAIRDDHGLLDE